MGKFALGLASLAAAAKPKYDIASNSRSWLMISRAAATLCLPLSLIDLFPFKLTSRIIPASPAATTLQLPSVKHKGMSIDWRTMNCIIEMKNGAVINREALEQMVDHSQPLFEVQTLMDIAA